MRAFIIFVLMLAAYIPVIVVAVYGGSVWHGAATAALCSLFVMGFISFINATDSDQ